MQVLVAERTKWLLFALWCLLWILVVAKSLQPDLQLPLGLPDKLVHFGTYALMAALVAGLSAMYRAAFWFWAALAVVMGGLLELGQGFVPSRSLELGDFLANAAGAGCGASCHLLDNCRGPAPLPTLYRPLRDCFAALPSHSSDAGDVWSRKATNDRRRASRQCRKQ